MYVSLRYEQESLYRAPHLHAQVELVHLAEVVLGSGGEHLLGGCGILVPSPRRCVLEASLRTSARRRLHGRARSTTQPRQGQAGLGVTIAATGPCHRIQGLRVGFAVSSPPPRLPAPAPPRPLSRRRRLILSAAGQGALRWLSPCCTRCHGSSGSSINGGGGGGGGERGPRRRRRGERHEESQWRFRPLPGTCVRARHDGTNIEQPRPLPGSGSRDPGCGYRHLAC